MAIERGLYGMPNGEDTLGNQGEVGIEEVLEIEVEMPEIS